MTKRILVVEDQKDLRGALRDRLSGSHYQAVDGAESVAKATSERPDLMLVDIRLPVLDGFAMTPRMMRASIEASNTTAAHRFGGFILVAAT